MRSDVFPYTYPAGKHRHRHGPAGYDAYESYRPWVRDEFSFRCVYCLHRERFSTGTAAFALDHVQPRSLRSDLTNDYRNLAYACSACNTLKSGLLLPDFTRTAYGHHLRIAEDGTLEYSGEAGRILCQVLHLNRGQLVNFRAAVIAAVRRSWDAKAADGAKREFLNLMGWPGDLPNLVALRPPSNTRPEGLITSWFALREAGELPDWY